MSRTSIALATTALLAACGGSNNNTTPDAGTPDAGTGTSTAAACASYCTTMVATCTATDAQFDAPNDAAACNAACTTIYGWPQTDPNAKADDITCRTQHAGLAATAKAASDAAGVTLHCKHAGPTGFQVCGQSFCDVYCDLQVRNCSTTNPLFTGTANFASRDACETACVAASFATTGTVGATSGNTVQCRIWHLGKAQAGPATHCPHTRVISVNADLTAGPCS
jgi:hypothetical protein